MAAVVRGVLSLLPEPRDNSAAVAPLHAGLPLDRKVRRLIDSSTQRPPGMRTSRVSELLLSDMKANASLDVTCRHASAITALCV